MAEKIALFFCSAAPNIDPGFNKAARDFVHAAVAAGYTISSGVTIKGTMGVVCEATQECGGKTIGAIPTFMKQYVNPICKNPIWVDTMAERKEALRKGANVIIALPGGIGTLDELAETITLFKLKVIDSTIVVANIDGFYEPFRALLEHYVRTGMLDRETCDSVHFVSDVEEFKALL